MKKLLFALCLIAVSCSKDEPSNDDPLNSYSPPELFLKHTQEEVIAAWENLMNPIRMKLIPGLIIPQIRQA